MCKFRTTLIVAVASISMIQFCNSFAEEKPPIGWLIGEIGESGVAVSGWAQASITAIDNDGDSTLPQGFFNREDGFTLNQLGIMVEKKPQGNVVGRVGPFPGPKPDAVDVGFNVTAIYGNDAIYFRTIGWDDDLGNNDDLTEDDGYLTIAQAFLDIALPVFDGSNLMLGLFHTPLENEIGFPLPSPAPAPFFSHPYSFSHGPAKHFGALFSSKLSGSEGESLLGFELGLVRGWNNYEDENGDLDIIFNLRWRSPDLSTWIDFENIYGNGADDSFPPPCACGSPIPAVSAVAGDDELMRRVSYLTVSHAIDTKNRIAVELTSGSQEKSTLAGNKDADWSGININWHHQMAQKLGINLRAEYFETDGVHVLLPEAGELTALTANATWNINHALRIRPEIRYDTFDGGTPFNGEDTQTLFALDAIYTF